jgi:hypothetical protein
VTRRDRGLAQLVRAAVSKTAGREFESLSPCHFLKAPVSGPSFLPQLAAGRGPLRLDPSRLYAYRGALSRHWRRVEGSKITVPCLKHIAFFVSSGAYDDRIQFQAFFGDAFHPGRAFGNAESHMADAQRDTRHHRHGVCDGDLRFGLFPSFRHDHSLGRRARSRLRPLNIARQS